MRKEGGREGSDSPAVAKAVAAQVRSETLRSEALRSLEMGEFVEALARYDEALAAARETADEAFADWIYTCRSAAAAETGPAEAELAELQRILLRRRPLQTAFRAAYTTARIYELRGDLAKAARYASKARSYALESREPFLVCTAEGFCGRLLMRDCRFGAAEECYRRALDASVAPASVPEIHQALLCDNLGYCLMARGRVAEGLRLVHSALETLESLGAMALAAPLLLNLCYGYLQSARYFAARYFGEACLDRASGGTDDLLERTALYLLGEACRLDGDGEGARSCFDRLAGYPAFGTSGPVSTPSTSGA
jgi:tetratricopeptide (TPR) repeat protein